VWVESDHHQVEGASDIHSGLGLQSLHQRDGAVPRPLGWAVSRLHTRTVVHSYVSQQSHLPLGSNVGFSVSLHVGWPPQRTRRQSVKHSSGAQHSSLRGRATCPAPQPGSSTTHLTLAHGSGVLEGGQTSSPQPMGQPQASLSAGL